MVARSWPAGFPVSPAGRLFSNPFPQRFLTPVRAGCPLLPGARVSFFALFRITERLGVEINPAPHANLGPGNFLIL